MKLSSKIGLSAIALGMLAACVNTPIIKPEPPVDFAALSSYQMAVNETFVVNDGSVTDATRQFETLYSNSPEQALRNWVAERIQPVGQTGSFTVIIRDANVVSTPLATTGGISGYFKNEQAEKIDVYLHVILSAEGSARNVGPAEATISVRASHTVPEDASDDLKLQIYNSTLHKLMKLFNTEAEKQIAQHFQSYM